MTDDIAAIAMVINDDLQSAALHRYEAVMHARALLEHIDALTRSPLSEPEMGLIEERARGGYESGILAAEDIAQLLHANRALVRDRDAMQGALCSAGGEMVRLSKERDAAQSRAAEAEAHVAVMMEALRTHGDLCNDEVIAALQSAPESARKLLAVVEAAKTAKTCMTTGDRKDVAVWAKASGGFTAPIVKLHEALAALSEPRATEET